jgi:hypothetical protein
MTVDSPARSSARSRQAGSTLPCHDILHDAQTDKTCFGLLALPFIYNPDWIYNLADDLIYMQASFLPTIDRIKFTTSRISLNTRLSKISPLPSITDSPTIHYLLFQILDPHTCELLYNLSNDETRIERLPVTAVLFLPSHDGQTVENRHVLMATCESHFEQFYSSHQAQGWFC